MRLDTVEKWVRWAGGVGALAFAVAMFGGLWQATRRPIGRRAGGGPTFVRSWRSFYLPVSVAGLGLLYALWKPLPLRLSRSARMAALLVGAPLYFAGLALMLWGRYTLGQMYNVSSSLGAELYADHRLVTAGPFRYLRHPMYLGGIMAEIGGFLVYRTWTSALALLNAPILPLRARREEEALAAEFGQEWAEYARRVPMLLPRFR